MKSLRRTCTAFFAVCLMSAAAYAADASGTWKWTQQGRGGKGGGEGTPRESTLTLVQKDGNLTGKVSAPGRDGASSRCGFYLNLEANPVLKALYLDNENHDGYWRDSCVFRAKIDIEDTMNALVTYDTGATLTYSLNAFNAWEGYTVAFNGTKGRLEHSLVESVYVNGSESAQAGRAPEAVKIRVIPLRGVGREIEPWTAEGDHGGGDRLMLEEIFSPVPVPDKYLRAADERAGACSILVGVAANRSLKTGASVHLADLVPDMPIPNYPPMPTRAEFLPMPSRSV